MEDLLAMKDTARRADLLFMGSIKGWFVMSYVVCTTCYWLSEAPTRGPLRGPQRCSCEEQVKRQYVLLDCPSGFHLCYICATTLVGGTSRWSWEACKFCLGVNSSTQKEFGFSLALGRHSIMNGISIPLREKISADDQRVVDLLNFANFSVTLSDWGILRARQLFESVPEWESLKVVSLEVWQKKFKSSRETSLAALKNYYGVKEFSDLLKK
jgi:hypothetical protein